MLKVEAVLKILACSNPAINPNGVKMLLVNSLRTFFIKGKAAFGNGPKSLPWNPPACLILCNWVFDNFILTEELFAKALRSLETCVLLIVIYGENYSHH